jgi:hypothetical protein
MSDYRQVFLVKFALPMQDPDLPSPRYHTTLFVETEPNGNGTIHQVTGDIASSASMHYAPTPSEPPERMPEFHTSQILGVTPVSKHPGEWQRALESILASPQQKAFNIKTKTPLMFYEPGEPRRRLVKCTEWTMERAIPELKKEGLIVEQ